MNEQWQINNLISWKRKFKTQKLILKSNSRITLTGSWIRSSKLNQLSTWQEINFKFTFCGFSFTPMSKWRKVHETFLNTKIPFQKRTFYDHRVQDIPQVSSETSLPRLVQNKPSALICREENKVEFLERQFHSEKLSCVHKKETEHSFELSLSICVFYRRIFNLEMQNFSLENHHMMKARQPFCWSMTFTKVSNPFLPSPPKWLTWPLEVCGVYWFSLRIFSQTSLQLEFFPRVITVYDFVQHYMSWAIFFSVQDIFSPGIYLHAFFRNQSAGHFFWNHP